MNWSAVLKHSHATKKYNIDALNAVGLLENCMNVYSSMNSFIETELCQMRVSLILFEDSTNMTKSNWSEIDFFSSLWYYD